MTVHNIYSTSSATLPIWLDNVRCNGSENHIGDCSHSDWGVHDCAHSENVAISCYRKLSLSLINK